MNSELKSIELEYSKQFCKTVEGDEYITFTDINLPGMYYHNYTYIKDGTNSDKLKTIVKDLYTKCRDNKNFLMLLSDYELDRDILKLYNPQFTRFDYMAIDCYRCSKLKGRDNFKIKLAFEDEVYTDGIKMDIKNNTHSMGAFAKERIKRKVEIYKDDNSKIDFYVGYYKDICIGTCEILIDGTNAKIEDFSLDKKYHRKGLGTSFLKELALIAKKEV